MAILFTSSSAITSYQTVLVTVCGGLVYLGYSTPISVLTLALGQGGGPLLTPDVPVSIGIVNQHAYIVDGTNFVDVDIVAGTVVAMTTATSPPLPTGAGTLPAGCTLACGWRGRLILSGAQSNPQNVYASRVSNPYDWNYAATDPSAAWVDGPASNGRIGESVTALIPYTDDYMIVGAAHSIFMYQGDPAAQGTNVIVSQGTGIIGKDAWCVSPDNRLYYLATGGLFSVQPIFELYRPPENISKGSFNQFFKALDPGAQYTSLIWDADLHYMHIFVTPIGETAVGTHLIYDERNKGLWPQQFPINIGPTCATLYLDNNNPNQRAILLGGWDGYIRRYAFTDYTTDDDGTTISSSVTLGPFAPFEEAALLQGMTITLGEFPPGTAPGAAGTDTYTGDGSTQLFLFVLSGTFDLVVRINGVLQDPGLYDNEPGNGVFFFTPPTNGATVTLTGNSSATGVPVATATIKSGPDAYSVTEGTPHSVYAVNMYLERRQKTFRQRLRGKWFSVTLTNNSDALYFSFESALAEFDQSGRQRTIR